MAERVWPDAYRGIITEDQIAYMLDWMYSPRRIVEEISERGIHYRWIESSGTRSGFVGYGPLGSGEPCELHKFYLDRDHHGTGLASAAMALLWEDIFESGVSELRLRVNRNNRRAIRFYEKHEFIIEREDFLDIGGGFVMDDYLMVRSCH